MCVFHNSKANEVITCFFCLIENPFKTINFVTAAFLV